MTEERTHFRRGDRVRLSLVLNSTGTVKRATRPDDIRVLVLWDRSSVPTLEWRHCLVKISKQ